MKETLKLFCVALVGGAVAITGFEYAQDKDPEQISKESGVLSLATKECLEMVKQVGPNPNCSIVEVNDGSDCTPAGCKKIQGWSCNGAFMPVVVQNCLNEAMGKELEKP